MDSASLQAYFKKTLTIGHSGIKVVHVLCSLLILPDHSWRSAPMGLPAQSLSLRASIGADPGRGSIGVIGAKRVLVRFDFALTFSQNSTRPCSYYGFQPPRFKKNPKEYRPPYRAANPVLKLRATMSVGRFREERKARGAVFVIEESRYTIHHLRPCAT